MKQQAWNMNEADKLTLEFINEAIRKGSNITRIKFDYWNETIWIDWETKEGRKMTSSIEGHKI